MDKAGNIALDPSLLHLLNWQTVPPEANCTPSSSPSQWPSGCCLVADAGSRNSQTTAAEGLGANTERFSKHDCWDLGTAKVHGFTGDKDH